MDESLDTIQEEMEHLEIDAEIEAMETALRRGKIAVDPRLVTSRIPTKTPTTPRRSILPQPVSPQNTLPPSSDKRARPGATSGRRPVQRSQSVPASSVRPAFSQFSSTSSPVKKVPMNRVTVGTAPSPNLRISQSRVGSLTNTSHKPGGGQVKIESRRLDWRVEPRTKAVNVGYSPGGGDIKIEQRKLSWNVQSKIGSLEKTSHRPGGGDVKIENRRLDWNTQARVGSVNNIGHRPGGGHVKIHNSKQEYRVGSRIGSLANVRHKPGGGDTKIFDDKEYIRQTGEVVRRGGSRESIMSKSSNSGHWDSSTLVEPAGQPKSLHFVKSDQDPSSYLAQVTRKLSPMGSGLF